MTLSPGAQLAIIGASAALLMLVLWWRQCATRNATVVDVAWAAALGGAAVLCAVTGGGDPWRRMLVGVMGGAWGARLTTHLIRDRLRGRPEDARYRELRARFAQRANRVFLLFFLFQALLVFVLAAPFAVASSAVAALGPIEFAALGLWLVAWCGESLADRQLALCKQDPTQRGRTCRAGLWRYSRHPNYFFEWLQWCAFAMLGLAASNGWLALSAPMLLLVLILKVTGIPPTEARALRSRGEDYRRYQRDTSAFVPWWPRRSKPTESS